MYHYDALRAHYYVVESRSSCARKTPHRVTTIICSVIKRDIESTIRIDRKYYFQLRSIYWRMYYLWSYADRNSGETGAARRNVIIIIIIVIVVVR